MVLIPAATLLLQRAERSKRSHPCCHRGFVSLPRWRLAECNRYPGRWSREEQCIRAADCVRAQGSDGRAAPQLRDLPLPRR